MKHLLEESRQQLLKPLGNARRKLLIILNIVYVVLVPVFLISEKIATGRFVNNPMLYLVYGVAVSLNLISAIYNVRYFRNSKAITGGIFGHSKRLDLFFGYASLIPILFMSCVHMLGFGNPSNDSILTDFALAQSLMIVTVIIIGRKAVIAWFMIIVAILFWNVSTRGWDYEYHYLTPKEQIEYKERLKNNDAWALNRKAELEKAQLNPPKITRYFNTWIVFIIVTFLVAYFFSGATIDILKIVPSVVNNIEQALEGSKMMEAEQKANQEKTKTFINLAHEMKTPLTLLNNYVDDYIKKYGTNKDTEIIKWNVQRMTTDIVNFFDIARFNKGFKYDHNQVTDLGDILSNKLPLYKSLAQKKNIELEDYTEVNCLVRSHPSGIERVMNNLVENALKFTPKNGKISISLSKRDNQVCFIVEDNGVGIPENLQPLIFEPYYQLGTNRNTEGMGMGLAIVKKIVGDIEGSISLFSETDRGTKVEVYLPVARPNEKELPAYFEVSGSSNLHFPSPTHRDFITDPHRPYILLVEDNVFMLSYLSEKFRQQYNVYVAINGEEALEKLKTIATLDLIISDVMMNSTNGFEFFREVSVNKKFSHVPFIFLTAKSTLEDKLEGLKLGAVDYIEKPFLIDQLLQKVDSLLHNFEKQRVAFVNRVHRLVLPDDHPGPRHYENGSHGRSDATFETNCKKFNLTIREIEIVNLIIKGMTYSAISETLNISGKTVAKHAQNIFSKVGASNKVELINKLQQSTITTPMRNGDVKT